mmetsp:Transcript_8302/g.10930  ORF Transcript_8302/g.10930 Transcript_8302/m.10930 type:complete len:82 (-) Transcript_8302:115-360(-)
MQVITSMLLRVIFHIKGVVIYLNEMTFLVEYFCQQKYAIVMKMKKQTNTKKCIPNVPGSCMVLVCGGESINPICRTFQLFC